MKSAGRVKRPQRWGVGRRARGHAAVVPGPRGQPVAQHKTHSNGHAHVRNVVGRTDKQKTMVPHTHAEAQANIRHARGGPSRGTERAWWRGGWEGGRGRRWALIECGVFVVLSVKEQRLQYRQTIGAMSSVIQGVLALQMELRTC
jgi:hypothetical protein